NMLEIYDSIISEGGNNIVGRTKLFIERQEDGDIIGFKSGTSIAPQSTGTLFIVDDWLIPQLDKVQFIDGVLSVKDGEELIPPVKSEKELQREALLKQLAELESQPSE